MRKAFKCLIPTNVTLNTSSADTKDIPAHGSTSSTQTEKEQAPQVHSLRGPLP